MSLLARYLFANNTESTGIIQTTTTATPGYATGSPFGYYCNGVFTISADSIAKVFNSQCLSISFWYRNTGTAGVISGEPGMVYPYNRGYTFYAYPNPEDLHFTIQDDDNNSLVSPVLNGYLTLNEWVNIILVNDNLTFTLYVNGEEVWAQTIASWNHKWGGVDISLVSRADANVADYRIYNHALSKKEIKDIQKAVSCHISFENISPTYMNRLCPDLFYPTSEWTFISCEWNSGSVLFQTGTTSMLTRSTTGIRPTANHKYYGSVEYKVEGTSMTWADNRFEWFLSDSIDSRITFFGCPQTTNYGWVKESAIVTAQSTMAQGNYVIRLFTVNSTLPWRAKNPLIVDLTEMFGAGNEPTKEWCDEHIDYFNGIMSDNLSDNSGGGASITSNYGFVTKGYPGTDSSMRQDWCYIGNNSAWLDVTVNPKDIRTYSMWVYIQGYDAYDNYLITDPDYMDYVGTIDGGGFPIPYFWGESSSLTFPNNEWAHLCFTVTDTGIYCYVNGVEELMGSDTSYVESLDYPYVAVLGNAMFQGAIADVKFAGVPWTAEQVQDEYQSKIVLDKSYNLYSRYFETPKPKIPNLMLTTLGSTQWHGGYVSTDHTRVDPSSRLMTGTAGQPESLSSLPQMAYMTLNHIYYSGFYCLREDTTASQSVQIYIPVAEPSLMAGVGLTSQSRVWQKCTARSTWAGSGWVNGLQAGRIDYNNQNSAGECWFTDMWIVDLTQYFGSGNEPTKEWCDKYLEYSPEGLIILDEPTKFKKTESIINSKYSEVGVKGRYIKVHMSGGNGGTRNAISKISYFDKDGGEITLADASTNEHSTIISGYQRTTMDGVKYFIVDNDTVIDIGTITTINAVRLVRENDISSYFYNTIISVSENNTDYVEIYNSYNNGSFRNDDRTNTYYETSDGKVFPAVATKYSQTYDTIKTTSIREVI